MRLLFFFRRKTVFYFFCGITAPYFAGRYILRDYRACSNDRTFPDSYSAKYDRTVANPHIILDNGFTIFPMFSIPYRLAGYIKLMIIFSNKNYRTGH